MSRTTLSTCANLGPLLCSSLVTAQSPAGADTPSETAASKTLEAAPVPAAEPEPVPDASSPAPAALPGAPVLVRGSARSPSSHLHTVLQWYGWQALTTDGAAPALSISRPTTVARGVGQARPARHRDRRHLRRRRAHRALLVRQSGARPRQRSIARPVAGELGARVGLESLALGPETAHRLPQAPSMHARVVQRSFEPQA